MTQTIEGDQISNGRVIHGAVPPIRHTTW